MAKVVLTGALAALATSCVLFVQPDTYGANCQIASEETSCGSCLVTSCQAEINACCKDSTCAAPNTLDACARGDAGGCDALRALASSANASERAVGTCAMQCAAVCRSFSGTSLTTCQEPSFGRGVTCTCSPAMAGTGNDFDCSPSSYAGTVCCAPTSWPDEGLECSCRPLGCTEEADGCFCQLVDTPPSSQSCAAANCCAIDDQCTCRPSCFTGERTVPSCTAPTLDTGLGCAQGQKRVASCSIRQ